MKIIAVYILLLASCFCSAQDKSLIEKKAREFFATAHDTAVVRVTIMEEDAEMYDYFLNKQPGEIVIYGNTIFLVRDFISATAYNYSIISLNKSKLGADVVKKRQNEIITKYNFGISFKELIDKYATPETGSEDITYHYEFLQKSILKDVISLHEPGKIYAEELSEDIVYIMVLNSPPTKQKTISALQPADDVKF